MLLMIRTSRCKGFISFDALFSILPIILIVSLAMERSMALARESEEAMHNQQSFDKLVSVADYTVKSGAAVRSNGIRYPNWIDEGALSEEYAVALKNKTGLESLDITMDGPGGDGTCIYRIVVSGQQKEIRRLFVCGS